MMHVIVKQTDQSGGEDMWRVHLVSVRDMDHVKRLMAIQVLEISPDNAEAFKDDISKMLDLMESNEGVDYWEFAEIPEQVVRRLLEEGVNTLAQEG